MATFPTYNANRNIQANTAAPLRNEAAEEFAPQQQLINAGIELNQKWSEANDVMQYTEAKAKYGVTVADIQNRAAADPNYKDSGKYAKELEAAKANVLPLISNKAIANKASMEFDMGNGIAWSKISSDFQQKQLKVSQFNAKQLVEGLEAERLTAPTIESANQYSLQIKQVLDANVQAGVLSLDEADKILKGSQKTAAQAMINSNPEEAKKMLTSGKFPDLSSQDLVNLLSIADKAQEQQQAEIKKAFSEKKKVTETQLQDKLFKETLTVNELEEQIKTPEAEGGADRNLLLAMKDNLYKAKKAKIEDYIGVKYPDSLDYVNTVDKALDSQTDLTKAREILIRAYGDGVISPEEGIVLDKIKAMSESIAYKKTSNPLEKGYLFLKNFSNGGYISKLSVEEQAQDLRNYITSVSKPEVEPEKIAEEIIENRKVANYPSFADWKKDQTYNTSFGPVKFIDRDKDGMPIVESLNGR